MMQLVLLSLRLHLNQLNNSVDDDEMMMAAIWTNNLICRWRHLGKFLD